MSRYRLSRTAQEDLVEIRDYYLAEAGYRVSRQMMVEFVEAFRFLTRSPGAGHVREDLAEDRPVLFWLLRDYLILYRAKAKPLEILAIVRGSRDVPALIARRGLR